MCSITSLHFKVISTPWKEEIAVRTMLEISAGIKQLELEEAAV